MGNIPKPVGEELCARAYLRGRTAVEWGLSRRQRENLVDTTSAYPRHARHLGAADVSWG